MLVFLPVFGLAGIEGRLLTPLAFAYIVALLASLAVAIVVTPALCYAFLPNARSIERGHDGWLARVLKARYAKDLPRILDRPAIVIATALLLLVMAGFALTRAGTSFLPEFHEGSLTVQANTLPGTSLAKSDEIGRRVEQILLSQPEVVATARRTGRAEYDEHVQGVEAAEIDVGLKETDRSRDELLAELRRAVLDVTGNQCDDRAADLAPHRSHAVGHPGEYRGEGLRRRSRHPASAGRARARDDGDRARGGRPVARAADGRAIRSVRAQSSVDRALRIATRRRGRSD